MAQSHSMIMTTIQHLAKDALPQHQGCFEEMDNDIDEIGKSINEDKNVMLEDVLDYQGVEFAEEMKVLKKKKIKDSLHHIKLELVF